MNYRIPQTLDNPTRCLGIPIDSIVVMMSVYAACVMFEAGFVGIVLAIIVGNLFSKYRSRSLIRRIVRFLYWYLPCELNFIRGIQGHQRVLKVERTCKIIDLDYSAIS